MKKGEKYPDFRPHETCINALLEHNKKVHAEKEKEWKQIANDNKLKCRACNLIKTLDNFPIKKTKYDYKKWYLECKVCYNLRKNKLTKDCAINKGLEWNVHCIYRNILNRISKEKKKNINFESSKLYEFNIDEPFLVKLFKEQNGLCKYSGRKIDFEIESQSRLSLDRIDSKKGYTKDNVVWCCWQANNIKQDLAIEDLKSWITDINKTINV